MRLHEAVKKSAEQGRIFQRLGFDSLALAVKADSAAHGGEVVWLVRESGDLWRPCQDQPKLTYDDFVTQDWIMLPFGTYADGSIRAKL